MIFFRLFKKKKNFPYFDIPFQSGDDAIIHAMNRRGTAESYQSLVCDIRKTLPNAVLRTTFLTGFLAKARRRLKILKPFLKI